MEEDTQAAPQPQTPPPPVQNQPVMETPSAPTEPVTQTDQAVKTVNPLMKRVDTLMGLGVIGIALSATLLAVALFANPY